MIVIQLVPGILSHVAPKVPVFHDRVPLPVQLAHRTVSVSRHSRALLDAGDGAA